MIFSRILPAATLLLVPSLAFASFSDVPSSQINATAINYVQAQGIVSGYSDGTYHPYQSINRAEFAKIMAGASLSTAPEGQQVLMGTTPCDANVASPFLDVPTDAWFWPFVCSLKKSAYIDGYPDGTFRPDSFLNFAEAAKIIANTFHLPATTVQIAGDPWYKGYVTTLGLYHAIPLSITRFDQSLSRGDMAEIIYRLKTNNANKPSRSYDQLVLTTNQVMTTDITYVNPDRLYSIVYPQNWSVRMPHNNVRDFMMPVSGNNQRFISQAFIEITEDDATCPAPEPTGGIVQTVQLGGRDFTAFEVNDAGAGTLSYQILFTTQVDPVRCLTLRKVIGVDDMQDTAQDQQEAAAELSTMQDTLKNVLKTIQIY